MRKLTLNQKNTLDCLTSEFQQLKDICTEYAKIQAKKGYNPNGIAINNCGDTEYRFKTYFVSGIGQVYQEGEAYYGEFQSECKTRVRKLIDYHIP